MAKRERTDEITIYIEELAALEDAKEHEADYTGQRGKGPYLRALARELRDKFTESAISDIPNVEKERTDRKAADEMQIAFMQQQDKEWNELFDRLKCERDEARANAERFRQSMYAVEEAHGRLRVALANVSVALVDSGVVVPEDEARYGEAVREIVRERDEARALNDELQKRAAGAVNDSDAACKRIAELEAVINKLRTEMYACGGVHDSGLLTEIRAALSPAPAQPATAAKEEQQLDDDGKPDCMAVEVIGDKTKCQPTDGQLSGLGFSSTKKAAFIVKVRQGKKQRLFNVKVAA